MPHGARDHLVQRAVAATGVEAHRDARVVVAPLGHETRGIARCSGLVDLAVNIQLTQRHGNIVATILAAGTRVDHKNMLHRRLYFFKLLQR